MRRKCCIDIVSSGQVRQAIDMDMKAQTHWYNHNKDAVWYSNIGPIQGRVMAIVEDKQELARTLMDSQEEYFKFCVPPPKKSCPLVLQVGPDPCDECYQDPTIPMRTPPPEQMALLFEGHSREGRGTYGYLRHRYNSGLPECRFCQPPTSNSEYAWKLQETVRNRTAANCTRKNSIASFVRPRGVLCLTDFAPFHFP